MRDLDGVESGGGGWLWVRGRWENHTSAGNGGHGDVTTPVEVNLSLGPMFPEFDGVLRAIIRQAQRVNGGDQDYHPPTPPGSHRGTK